MEPGDEVVAGRVRRHLVLELPPEEPAVELDGSLRVRLRGVDPARDTGRILASLQHGVPSLSSSETGLDGQTPRTPCSEASPGHDHPSRDGANRSADDWTMTRL